MLTVISVLMELAALTTYAVIAFKILHGKGDQQ